MSSVAYIELHTSSAFSFLRAASAPETLIERAAMLGYPAVALLDRDGVSGAPRFHKAALAAGLRPLIGAELTVETCRESGVGKPGVGRRPKGISDSRLPDSRFPIAIPPPRPGLFPGGVAETCVACCRA